MAGKKYRSKISAKEGKHLRSNPGQPGKELTSGHEVKEALPDTGRYFDTRVKQRQGICRVCQGVRSARTVS